MPDKNIYILSVRDDQVYSDTLSGWLSKRKSVDGIIIITSAGKKYAQVISSKERKEITAGTQSTYDWVNSKLVEMVKKNLIWVVVDGIGNSEVRGQGLFQSITEMVEKAKKFNKINVLFVVKDELVEIFIDYFDINIKNGKIISLPELLKLKHG